MRKLQGSFKSKIEEGAKLGYTKPSNTAIKKLNAFEKAVKPVIIPIEENRHTQPTKTFMKQFRNLWRFIFNSFY